VEGTEMRNEGNTREEQADKETVEIPELLLTGGTTPTVTKGGATNWVATTPLSCNNDFTNIILKSMTLSYKGPL
jgi:hypothetical protein